MKTILIEKTSKKLKLYELIITAVLFITLLTGFGAWYIAIPLALCRMERDWTMPDSICRHPHRHLVVSWINKIILKIPVVN